ncbi:MAG: (d)CMP kinase [Acuticoccus sp.]
MIVAVDGPAASGKGTLSRSLAAHFGFDYLDTGRTYRGVALALESAGKGFEDEEAAIAVARTLDFHALDDTRLGSPEVGEGASRIAVMPALRAVLVARQRAFANDAARGAVLDGRDIGTVVCPDAAVKLFITASVEVRARRRALQAFGTAEGAAYTEQLESLRRRDARDEGRAASPLRPAPDAIRLDTSEMTVEDALKIAVGLVENARIR